MEKLRDVTLLFLIKRENDKISEICLAMKKQGFGVGRWNGVGGKVESALKETVEEAAVRETREEIGVSPTNLKKVAELDFYFPYNPAWNQTVHTFFSDSWDKEPEESEEMKPKWFKVSEIPYDKMWSSDAFWLPQVLEGNLIKSKIVFGEGDVVKESDIKIVSEF